MLDAGAIRCGVCGSAVAGLSGAAALALLIGIAPAMAGDDFANTPVKQRRHSEYDPIGIRTDAFTIFPSVTVGLQYDSNVFASVDAVSDWALVTTPQALLVADRADGSYELDVGARHYAFRDLDSEDRTDAHVRFRLTRQVASDIKWDAAFEAVRKHEQRGDSFSRTDLAQPAEPIPYNDLRAETSITKTFNRLGVMVGGRVRRVTYEDVPLVGGGTLEQGFRDGTIITTTLKPFYDFSPGYKAYARIDLSKRDYEGTGAQDRDAQGFDARGGVEFKLTSMLLGSAELGYLSYDYDNPVIPSVDGLSAGARLMWLMTPLMTVTLFAERNVAEIAAQGQEGRLDFTAGAQLDYEILRNLILSLEGSYKNEDFLGIARTDDVIKLSAKLDYLVSRSINFGLAYNYIDRSSDIIVYDFDKHVVTLNVTAQH
jgi:hypothetical protein